MSIVNKQVCLITLLGVTVMLLSSGCAWKSDLKQARSKLEAKQSRIDKMKDKISQLNSELEALREQNNALQQRGDDLRKLVDKKKQTIAKKENQIASLKDRIDTLESQREERLQELEKQNQELQQRLSEVKEAKARVEGQNVVVTLEARLLFDLGKANLREPAKDTLNQVAEVIGEYPERQVIVEGHADTQPILIDAINSFGVNPTNWHLSAARSVSVIQYLVRNQGLTPKRFVAAGYGDHHPVAPNATAEGRQKNRRVEIGLFPPEQEKKPLSIPRGSE